MYRRPAVTILELLVGLAVVGVLVGMVAGAVARTRAAADKAACADHLRQVVLAAHAYHGVRGKLPVGYTSKDHPDKMPSVSWLTRLLPFVERGTMWDEAVAAFQVAPRFHDPAHTGRHTVLPLFTCPGDSRTRTTAVFSARGTDYHYGLTSYLGCEGKNAGVADGVPFTDSAVSFADISDGLSSTLLAAERPPSPDLKLGWWYAGTGQRQNGDAEYLLGVRTNNYHGRYGHCPPGPHHFGPGKLSDDCSMFHYWSVHPGGAHAAFADGSVRFLKYDADAIMPALASRAARDSAPLPD